MAAALKVLQQPKLKRGGKLPTETKGVLFFLYSRLQRVLFKEGHFKMGVWRLTETLEIVLVAT